jgi:hypothetical protein
MNFGLTNIGSMAIKLFVVAGIILIGYMYIRNIIDQNNKKKDGKTIEIKVPTEIPKI